MSGRAKIFWNGRSQAVRLPKEFRFEGKEVSIRRDGQAVILEPIEKPGWPEGFWKRFLSEPPLAENFELPERPAPSAAPAYRDRVIEEWVESVNEEE
jgi:antitoxin VapB